MSVDVFVLDHPGQSDPLTPDFQVLARQQLVPGRSYVILAKGDIFSWVSEATFRLEAHDATDQTMFTQGAYPPIFQGGHGSFTLAITTTLPDNDEFAAAAVLSGATPLGLSLVRNVKLIVMAVDSLIVTTR